MGLCIVIEQEVKSRTGHLCQGLAGCLAQQKTVPFYKNFYLPDVNNKAYIRSIGAAVLPGDGKEQ